MQLIFLVLKYHSVEKARPNSNQGETDRKGEINLDKTVILPKYLKL